MQARSEASVEAILEATVQVLLEVGKERLTTTRVATRAGVSVGTLYQYFPNKKSLLQMVLERHMEEVAKAVEEAAARLRGASVEEMARGAVKGFLAPKLRSTDASKAMYGVSEDVDGRRIVLAMSERGNQAISKMLKTAKERVRDPETVAMVMQATMAGVSRRMLDGEVTRAQVEALKGELAVVVEAYVKASVA